jgi:hypothetical protein
LPIGDGSHAVAWPVVTSIAARLLRLAPPIVANEPPAYTTPVPSASAYTLAPGSEALGSHAVASPVAASSAAM